MDAISQDMQLFVTRLDHAMPRILIDPGYLFRLILDRIMLELEFHHVRWYNRRVFLTCVGEILMRAMVVREARR